MLIKCQNVLSFLCFSLQAQKRELDHIRQNYRKNSLARSAAKGVSTDPNAGTSSGESGSIFQRCVIARDPAMREQREEDDEDD